MAAPATPATPSAPGTPVHGQSFDSALRGYERRQVDEYVLGQQREVNRLRGELAETQRGQRAAAQRADVLEQELRSARNEPRPIEESFGYRAEKLLRLAEQEAVEARESASREAVAVIEQARTQAEKHRHEVEQSLISRASQLEQQSSQRVAELQEREQQIAAQLSAAREQADQLHAAATRAADRLRQESEAAAAETRQRAESAAAHTREQAGQEVNRLTAMQADVRSELARLADVLATELAKDTMRSAGRRTGEPLTPTPRSRHADPRIPEARTPEGRPATGGRPAGGGRHNEGTVAEDDHEGLGDTAESGDRSGDPVAGG